QGSLGPLTPSSQGKGPSGLPSHWYARQDTWDGAIFEAVANDNEYDLPDAFGSLDVILDVGAHCGAFSWTCLVRGAGRVFAYEVEPDNFAILERNLHPYAHAFVGRNVAVWRSDLVEP